MSVEAALLDTNILILQSEIDPEVLPAQLAISTITLAELSAGVHQVDENAPDAAAERARRLDVLQRSENTFDPIPFDAPAARMYGRMAAAVKAIGRSPRRRTADLMIAAVAAVNNLPLCTTNPDDYTGLDSLLAVIPVPRP
ncbi:MAG: type II toxin-antitoxin system VapC family toxin [Propionibacteriaceae bacterium]|nr:type II toxin-antitoxin system VapC family toxin [Propionibacteriaceae bacterium]